MTSCTEKLREHPPNYLRPMIPVPFSLHRHAIMSGLSGRLKLLFLRRFLGRPAGMETRLFRPQPSLVAEALVSRITQLVLLPLSTSRQVHLGFLLSRHHIYVTKSSNLNSDSHRSVSYPCLVSNLDPDPTLLLADLLGLSLFPAPSWTSTRPPPHVMRSGRVIRALQRSETTYHIALQRPSRPYAPFACQRSWIGAWHRSTVLDVDC